MQKNLPKILILSAAFVGLTAFCVGLFKMGATPTTPTPTIAPTTAATPSATSPTAEPTTAPVPTARALTLSQALGQRIIYSYEGTAPPPRLKQLIERGEVGGIIIFKRNVRSEAALASTLRELQALPRPAALQAPLMIMLDQEGGRVKRLPGPPDYSPQALGQKGSPALTRSQGEATGRYLKANGINVNLAPLVDVARPGTYQERSKRSYGREAPVVAQMSRAFADGLLAQDVVPCFKHYPGMGTAPVDEDAIVNRLDISRAELDAVDQVPFSGAPARSLVMTSTGLYRELDAKMPALFSRRIVTQRLRDEMGFRGLTITDDLEVPALQSYGSSTERGRLAIVAGNDILLYCVSLAATEAALRGLTKLYQNKTLDSNELYQTTARVLDFRAQWSRGAR